VPQALSALATCIRNILRVESAHPAVAFRVSGFGGRLGRILLLRHDHSGPTLLADTSTSKDLRKLNVTELPQFFLLPLRPKGVHGALTYFFLLPIFTFDSHQFQPSVMLRVTHKLLLP
jgi:hypothetical protein